MAFEPRLSAPSTSNKWWKHTSAGGKNSCILISGGSVLPNCVGYAWGRFGEILGKAPKLSRGNAENWWDYNDGYERGQTPKLGAVACWRKGKAGVSSDGAGHVAVVEKVYEDGSITISNSGYKSTRFWTQTLKKGYKMSGYTFQGFIYNPAVSDTSVTKPASSSEFKVGKTYTLQAAMKVRAGAGTSKRWKKRSELTADGKKHAQSGEYAVLKKGTKVTCMKVVKSGSEIWLQVPSGYICAKQGGTVYVK